MMLVYIAIIWANATALPIIFRHFIGDFFMVGPHYSVAGFEIYAGEVSLSFFAILLIGLVCMRGRRMASRLQTFLAFVLIIGIFTGFCAAVAKDGCAVLNARPFFYPNKKGISAVFNIVALTPWAFVGFESVSHSASEFTFSTRKVITIIIMSVLCSAFSYIALNYIAIAAIPKEYGNWMEYINDIHKFTGLDGLPTFHSVHMLLGRFGVVLLGFTVVAGVVTGLLGNYVAASRMIFSMTTDGLLPQWFGKVSSNGTPRNAVFFIMLFSLPIPFLGRTAIGWIVDVSTIGATVAYLYTSAVAFKVARKNGNLLVQATGVIGGIVSILFFLYFMIPNFWTVSAFTTESYLMLLFWSILGLVFFRYIFNRDVLRRFGQSTVVWLVFLLLIFFTSILWLRENTHENTGHVLHNLSNYNTEELAEHGIALTESEDAEAMSYIQTQMELVNTGLTKGNIVQMALITMALLILFNIYNMMMKRESDMEIKKIQAEAGNRAKSVFLSNMSHDIRTPMNAIVGFTDLAKKEADIPPKTRDYLDKIEQSSNHLLGLINDILDISRIESGKMTLDIERCNLVAVMDDMRNLFALQMEGKKISFSVVAKDVVDKMVLCDKKKLNRILQNLVSNAFKFTPEGGAVTVTLSQSGANEGMGATRFA